MSRYGYPASSPVHQVRRATRSDSRTIVTPFVQAGTYPTRNFATFRTVIVTAAATLGEQSNLLKLVIGKLSVHDGPKSREIGVVPVHYRHNSLRRDGGT